MTADLQTEKAREFCLLFIQPYFFLINLINSEKLGYQLKPFA